MSISGYTLYELILLFFLYAFLGWCSEVCFAAMTTGRFSNRGFLNGPICPIYGVGALIVILALTPVTGNLAALFFSSAILTTLLEYLTGLVLENVFHAKWWDYSDRPFNVQGYICLEFSILWGFACVGIMKLMHPTLYALVRHLPHVVGLVMNSLFLVLLAVDLTATVMAMHHLNQRLALITRTAQRIHSMSDRLGENLYEGTVTAKAKHEEAKEALEDTKEKLSQQKLVLEDKVGQLQSKALESAEERAQATADRLGQLKEAAQQRSVAAAEALSLRQEGKTSKEQAELLDKLHAALSERHFLQELVLRAHPFLKPSRHQGAFAQLRKFHAAHQTELPDPEAILTEGTPKPSKSHPKPLPHTVAAFLLGLAVGVVLMLVLNQLSVITI